MNKRRRYTQPALWSEKEGVYEWACWLGRGIEQAMWWTLLLLFVVAVCLAIGIPLVDVVQRIR